MKKIVLLAALLAALASVPARADYIIKDGNGVLKSVKSGILAGSVILSYTTPTDAAGVPIGSIANPLHVNCDAGCSGGGGGGSVFGPTAAGSPAANPPILIGGTIDGTATGNVSVFKVVAGVGFINCANCSGSGISVTFGAAIGAIGTPNGYKDGSGNFQPILGDVTNGQWVSIKASVPIASTIANGANVTFGSMADLPTTLPADSTATTGMALLKSIANSVASQLPPGINTIGSIANTGFVASQPTASALNATVVGTGTFAVQSTFSGSLPSGSNTLGTVNLGTLNGAATSAFQASNSATTAHTCSTAGYSILGCLGQLDDDIKGPIAAGTNAIGTVNPSTAANWGLGATGAAVPANAQLNGMSQGGNLVAFTGTSGNLNVQCANCSGSGVSTADAAAFTAGSSLFAGGGGFFQTTATSNALTTGQQGMFQVTANRALFSNLRNAAGTEIGTASTPIQVSLANTAANGTAVSVSLAANQSVNVAQINGVTPLMGNGVTGTGSPRVTIASDNTAFTVNAAQSGTWNLTNISGTVSLPTGASTSANQTTINTSIGTTNTNLGAPGATACASDTASCSVNQLMQRVAQNLTTLNTTAAAASTLQAAATGGASTTGNIVANNTTAVVVKASAGTLYGAQISGIGSAPAYVKFYNATSATCGSGTPVKRLTIPAAATAANGNNSNVTFGSVGVSFGTGITYCVTTGIADNDTTAPAASTFLVNLDWQ